MLIAKFRRRLQAMSGHAASEQTLHVSGLTRFDQDVALICCIVTPADIPPTFLSLGAAGLSHCCARASDFVFSAVWRFLAP